MLFLPKGVPLLERQPAWQEVLPTFLSKWSRGQLSGYVRYSFDAALSDSVLIFSQGKLITVKTSNRTAVTSGLEALTALAQRATTEENGFVDVYRVSPQLVSAINGVLHGEFHLRAQEMKSMDVQGLAAKIKSRKLNGCVRVYTATRCSLIFYRDGAGTGFFHDGSEVIETGATEDQRIANQAGAKMDVMSTPSADQLQAYDLLEMLNVQHIWDHAWRANQARAEELHQRAAALDRQRLDDRLTTLEESLKAIAAAAVGPMGHKLVAQELTNRGGRACLARPAEAQALIANVEKGARMVAGASKVKELVEHLRAELERQLPSKT